MINQLRLDLKVQVIVGNVSEKVIVDTPCGRPISLESANLECFFNERPPVFTLHSLFTLLKSGVKIRWPLRRYQHSLGHSVIPKRENI